MALGGLGVEGQPIPPGVASYGNPDGQEDMVIIRIAERPVDRPDEGAVRIVRKPR